MSARILLASFWARAISSFGALTTGNLRSPPVLLSVFLDEVDPFAVSFFSEDDDDEAVDANLETE